MIQFLLKIFRSVLNLLSAELPDSRGICVVREPNWLKNDDWICTGSRKLHDRPRVIWCTQCGAAGLREGHTDTVQRLDTTQFYCPPGTLKWKSDDLIFAWSRKLHDNVRRTLLGVHSVWQPADERVTAVSKTGHNTLLLPPSVVLCLESVMSDKMCVCVCVHRQFSSRVPKNRSLCVFCTFHRYFRRVPAHMQPKSVSCSSHLACSSRLALDLCTTVLPNAASLPMPRFGWNQQTLTEHCQTRQAPNERELRMSGCLLCLFGWMCLFSVKNRRALVFIFRLF